MKGQLEQTKEHMALMIWLGRDTKQWRPRWSKMARKVVEMREGKEQVPMLREELARCRAAPGGSWGSCPPRPGTRPGGRREMAVFIRDTVL